jgi:hypothetical protein
MLPPVAGMGVAEAGFQVIGVGEPGIRAAADAIGLPQTSP